MKKNEIEVSAGRKEKSLFGKVVKAVAVIAAVKGAVYVAKNVISQKAADRERHTKDTKQPEVYAFMVARRIGVEGEEYNGAVYTTFMGGLDIDLSKAVIKEDISVTCRNFMGGINLKVPNDINVSVSGSCFMGGVANMVPENRPGATIYLRAECFMGGTCIRMAGVEKEAEPEGTENPADQAEPEGQDAQDGSEACAECVQE